jgi:hypothetical protein
MNVHDVWGTFRQYLADRGVPPPVDPAAAVEAMIGFYRDVRADDCQSDSGDDMLFVQWGPHKWLPPEHPEFRLGADGLPEPRATFGFTVIRQLIAGEPQDDNLYQLRCKFAFPCDGELATIQKDKRWCHGLPELPEFTEFVREQPVLRAAAHREGWVDVVYYKV